MPEAGMGFAMNVPADKPGVAPGFFRWTRASPSHCPPL